MYLFDNDVCFLYLYIIFGSNRYQKIIFSPSIDQKLFLLNT